MLLDFFGFDYIYVHRKFTHSLVRVFIVFLLMWGYDYILFMRSFRYRLPYVMISECLLSHIGLDMLGEDLNGPNGMMLLWPLSTTFIYADANSFLTPFHSDGDMLPLRISCLVGMREVLVIGALGFIVISINNYLFRKEGKL